MWALAGGPALVELGQREVTRIFPTSATDESQFRVRPEQRIGRYRPLADPILLRGRPLTPFRAITATRKGERSTS